MIETSSDITRFQTENSDGDWIMHVVPLDDSVHHPVTSSPSILFIRNILSGKTYYFSFNHPDSISSVTHAWFVNEFLLNHKNRKWALDKKSFVQMLRLPDMNDANLCGFCKKNSILDLSEYETSAHSFVRRNSQSTRNLNRCIPILKHKEAFDEMADDIQKMIKGHVSNDSFNQINGSVLDTLSQLESNGIFVDKELFEKRFHKPNESGLVYSQYNIYTSTGRPSNRFGGVNYAALNHIDGSRSCFVSRFGDDGRMVVVDYAAFHPRIICKLINYDLPVNIDIYEYLAKLYYRKKEIDDTDIKNAKQLTFKQLYGGVDDEYAHIKYLAALKGYIDDQWFLFEKNGYAETPVFKRKITEHHIQDPNPTKLFNYLLQAAEGEIAIPRLELVQKYLNGFKTKPVLYTYDAVLYDFHKDDGVEVLNKIRELMSFDGEFPMKTYIGKSYHNVKLVTI